MTSRERVVAALDHREPDRTPIDMAGMRSTGIMAMAYGPLSRHLGLNGGDAIVYDMVQQLALPEDPIPEAFGVDVSDLGRAYFGLRRTCATGRCRMARRARSPLGRRRSAAVIGGSTSIGTVRSSPRCARA